MLKLNGRLTRDFGAENFLCCSVHPAVIQTQGELSPAMRVTQAIKTVEKGVYGFVSDKIKGGINILQKKF